jgi:C4-dicarboxylate-specific signal transduction histidine kinase
LINLINNSIDAVSSLKQKDKWININTEKVGETVRISVTDCGMGIPSQVVESMFNSFYTTKESGKGTGLGLSISTKIIKNHGGNLYYDETSENTRFVIDFDKAAF